MIHRCTRISDNGSIRTANFDGVDTKGDQAKHSVTLTCDSSVQHELIDSARAGQYYDVEFTKVPNPDQNNDAP